MIYKEGKRKMFTVKEEIPLLWGIAQLAEQEAVNFKVPGSSPGIPATVGVASPKF